MCAVRLIEGGGGGAKGDLKCVSLVSGIENVCATCS